MEPDKSGEFKTRTKLHIRPFEKRDAGQVAAMTGRYFPLKDRKDVHLLKDRLISSLSSSSRSLVCSSSGGNIHGYLCIKLIDFKFRKKPVTGAIFSDFMVSETARKELIPMKMLRKGLTGPQDFSFSDDAGHASRLLWCSLGGYVAFPYSIYYTFPLKPLSFSVQMICKNAAPMLQSFSGAIAGGMDHVLEITRKSLSLFSGLPDEGEVPNGRDLSKKKMTGDLLNQGLLSLENRFDLVPSVTAEKLRWFIMSLKAEMEQDPWEAIALIDSSGRPAGWYLYYIHPQTKRCNVIHAECLPGMEEVLFRVLVSEAKSKGCISLSGRLSPLQNGSSFSERTLSRPGGKWSLIHSKERDILFAVQSGKAFLARCW